MTLGDYDQRVQFTRQTVTGQDSFGQDVTTTTSMGTFWAHVSYMTGRELQAAQQRWAEAQYSIEIQRQPGITLKPSDQIVWNSQTLDVVDIQGQGTRSAVWTIIAKDHIE